MASVNLENKSARILIIGLGGGGSITVPPTDPTTGVGAITVKFASDDDKARFDRAISTPAVQEWIESGELVTTDVPDEAESKDDAAKDDEPKDETVKPPRAPAQPERKRHGLFGGEREPKDHKEP